MTDAPSTTGDTARESLVSRIVEVFLRGNLSVLLIVISLAVGTLSLLTTPREEDPQIVVPMADVLVQVPGASAEEVEQQVSTRLERLLYQIDGVEYVYSMSRPGQAIVTVRFYVGENREDSLVKLYNKIAMNTDQIPPGVTGWVVKPKGINDVPIVDVTLWSNRYGDDVLRRIAEQVEIALQSVPDTGETSIIGGRPRQISIWLDTDSLAAHGITPLEVVNVLRGANFNVSAGSLDRNNREMVVNSGGYLQSDAEIKRLVVGVDAGRPVYLAAVARVEDGPAEPSTYTRICFGAAHTGVAARSDCGYPAVTVAVAKKKGTNAVTVAEGIQRKLEQLRPEMIPTGVELLITRDYGESANDKVNELVRELGLAIVIVVGLIAFSLGWREAIIVVTAVPLTFALTLLVNYLAGYSINRVTLFALILALGLVVDDPIVDVENIFRHFAMRKEPPIRAVLTAVNEVRPPIIVATLVVIVSFLPMFFITGMMGPYMRPMALNVPVAMLMSMVVAFTITPWLSYHVLKGQYGKEAEPFDLKQSLIYRMYRAILGPLLRWRALGWLLIATMMGLLVLASLLPLAGLVPLKMLPYDNKNEFQIVVDMPAGTTLEETQATLQALASYLQSVPEVTEILTFSGTSSPMDFNGLVRHYYLRRGQHVGDIRVNLIPKQDRQQQSHAILLRLRNDLKKIARAYHANVKLVEMPPGPPVLATLVAEVYGRPEKSYAELIAAARHVRRLFESQPGVGDVDDTVQADQVKWVFRVDKQKASLHGVSTEAIAKTTQIALEGYAPDEEMPLNPGPGVLHLPRELNPLEIRLRLPVASRSDLAKLSDLGVKTSAGDIVRIGGLGKFEKTLEDQTIYHKNLRRVVYVFGETVGSAPPEEVLALQSRLAEDPTPGGTWVSWWGEGEWRITLKVFRDLGLAFGAALLAIYIILVWQTASYTMPLIQMVSIPLTVIGIMPGFWLLNTIWNQPVGGYPDPVFFTATAMIGMIALAGIADRNAILLIDFIHVQLQRGASLRDALLESGAVRFRPIVLTAGAAMLGAWPITLDPVFSGLAWALIFGLLVSTAFTLLLVPTVYWLLYEKRPGHGLPTDSLQEKAFPNGTGTPAAN